MIVINSGIEVREGFLDFITGDSHGFLRSTPSNFLREAVARSIIATLPSTTAMIA